MAALADQLAKLVPLGMPIPQRWVREKWGIPEAAPDEPVLGAPAKTGEPLANLLANPSETPGSPSAQAAQRRMQSAHAQAAEPTPDAIDELVAEALSGWEPQMQPMVDPLQALLDRAAAEGWTAQQLIDALPGVIDDMDAAQLTDALARAAFVARLAGVHGREIGRE